MSRGLLGATAWSGTLLTTGSIRLAEQSWNDFISGEIKAGLRRCGWYARKGWMRLNVVGDPFFIFSEGVNHQTLDALERLIENAGARDSEVARRSDHLLVMAQRLHLKVRDQETDGYLDSEVRHFYHCCNDLLELTLSQSQSIGSTSSTDKTREGDFSKKDAIEALEDFATILPLDKCPWFVESGTFLGLHRDGGFLPHDYDIDLGIDYEDCDLETLIDQLEAASSFVVKKVDAHIQIVRHANGRYEMSSLPALVKLVHKSGVNVDIFLHHCHDGYSWHGSSIHWWKNKIFDLERRTMEGIEVNAPRQAEQYLTENYGDWRTPVTNFDCTSGTPNLTIAKNFLSIALFLKRLSVFSKKSPREAVKVKQALLDSGVLEEQHGRLIMRHYI